MKRALSVAFVLAVALAGRGDEKKPVRDPLPRAESVEWDLQIFEDSPAFEVVKRGQGNTVTGSCRTSGTSASRSHSATRRRSSTPTVKLFTLGIETNPFLMNMPKGERNRFVLNLPRAETGRPPARWLKNGLYTN